MPSASTPATTTRHRRAGVGIAAVVALAVTGLGAAPARSATDPACPDPYPVSALTKGQPVTGLTVSSGTVPDGFTGQVLGVQENGLMPGLDLVLVRLTSPELERVGGIWSGMSGSPVYAADGRLIGAVSLGLAAGPSTVAGVTPAADMLELLSSGAGGMSAANRVALPRSLARTVVRDGAATAQQVQDGMATLELPFGIAGLGSQKRLSVVAKRLPLDGVRVMRAGTTTATGAGAAGIVPGGNLAASVAYGDITAGAVGTVTAVCGTGVVGWGHPLNWSGPATMTMHGADTLFVQEDPTYAGFKVTNIGSPVGTVDQDRIAGIAGHLGATPPTSDVTSHVTSGSRTRTGTTHVTVGDAFPDIAMAHLLANQDRLFDGIGKGSGRAAWTVSGRRADGTAFTLRRSDIYADPADISFATAADLYDALSRLRFNGVEDISFGGVDVTSSLDRGYDHYALETVKVRRGGAWVAVTENDTLLLRPGSTQRLKVRLVSPVSGPRVVVLEVPVPRRAAGLFGTLDVYGGNSGLFSDEGFYGEEPPPDAGGTGEPSVDDVLKAIRTEPHNDQVVAHLAFYDEAGNTAKQRMRRTSTGLVVDGARSFMVETNPGQTPGQKGN
jgi:hypothetical protein